MYEDGGSEEPGDGVWIEGLHRSRDLSDAGGGGHLQGPGELDLIPVKQGKQSFNFHDLNVFFSRSDFDPGCD